MNEGGFCFRESRRLFKFSFFAKTLRASSKIMALNKDADRIFGFFILFAHDMLSIKFPEYVPLGFAFLCLHMEFISKTKVPHKTRLCSTSSILKKS